MQNKSPIFSKIFRFIVIVILALFLTIGLISIGVPKFITFFIIIVLYLIYTAVWPAYIIYRTKSIALVDRYLKNNAGQVIFGYALALGNGGSQKDIEAAIERIMNAFEDMKDIYGALLSVHRNQPDKIIKHAKNIADQEYKDYYMAYGYILKGDFAEAVEHSANVKTSWMVHTLKAIAAKQRGDFEAFKSEGQAAIESTQGIQRYTSHHTMRRLEGEFKKAQ